MKDTPTPRTDAEHAQFPMGGFTLDFARQLERELIEAQKLAERYRYLSCDSQEEADETILPWENNNKPTKQCVARSAEDSEAQDKTETDDALWVALQFKKP